MSHVLFIGEDPGGVDVIVPLYRRLAGQGVACTVLSRTHGNAVWQRYGIAYTDLGTNELDEADTAKLLKAEGPAVLVSATSFPRRLEKTFRKSARRLGIPSVAVMDADRPDLYVTTEEERSCRGDYVLSISERMSQGLLGAGYAANHVLTVGHLGLGVISAEGRKWTPAALADWASSFRMAHDGRPLITIFSDNITEVFGVEGALTEIGYHERHVVPQILAAIRRIVDSRGRRFELVIKLHPKEEPNKFDALVASGDENLNMRVVRDCENVPLILCSDRILGMYSIVMVWSAVLGRPTLSVQPGARKRTLLVTAHEGKTPALWQPDGLESAVERFLRDDTYYAECCRTLESWRPPVGGIDMSVALIRRLMEGADVRASAAVP